MHEVVPHLPIQVQRSQLLRKFHGQDQTRASRGNPAVHRTVRIVERNLREDRNSEPAFLVIVKPPFQTELVLPQPESRSPGSIVPPQISGLERQLNPVSQSEMDIDIGSVRNG